MRLLVDYSAMCLRWFLFLLLRCVVVVKRLTPPLFGSFAGSTEPSNIRLRLYEPRHCTAHRATKRDVTIAKRPPLMSAEALLQVALSLLNASAVGTPTKASLKRQNYIQYYLKRLACACDLIRMRVREPFVLRFI